MPNYRWRWRLYNLASALAFVSIFIAQIPKEFLFGCMLALVVGVCLFEPVDRHGRRSKFGIPVSSDNTLDLSRWPFGGANGYVSTKLSTIRAIVVDIEGTTSSLSFVHDVLFPYARARLPAYVAKHGGDLDQLLGWMDADAKVTELKDVQGRIWAEGYAKGELTGHVYRDAAEALRRWHAAGLKLAVFSSGSVAAQKLIFGHSVEGNLAPLFSGWFDTTTGPKREAMSYVLIADALGVPPAELLFLSDVAAETDAAKAAGMKAILVDREKGGGDIANFTEIAL